VDTVEALQNRLRPRAEWDLVVRGPRDTMEAAFRGIPCVKELAAVPAEAPDSWRIRAVTGQGDDPREDIDRIVVERNFRLLEMRPARLSLEDIFMGLMTGDGT